MENLRDIGESVGNTVMERVGRAMGRAQERSPLPVDLLESEDAYLAVFDSPGATSTDVQVQYREGAVEVRIDRFRGFHEGFDMRYPGRGLSLDGRVELPGDAHVDADAASATLQDNGTLHVRVPKRADDEAEPIEIDDANEDDADADPDDES
jgi:HSP20 family molecular chaperone IbpA